MNDEEIDFNTSHKRLASGRKKVYYYTAAGTRFFETMDFQIAAPYPAAFGQAYKEAIEWEISGSYEGDCARFIDDYLASEKFTSKAKATREGYERALKSAREKFGSADIKVIEDRRFRGAVISWQYKCAEKSPRQADLNIQALSLALDHAYKRGHILHNPAADIDPLYKRPDNKKPWADWQCEAFLDGASETERNAFLLARHTGLRRADLARITWSAFKGDHIEWLTSKGRGKRLVIIPLTEDAIAFLYGLRASQGDVVTMLVGNKGKPVSADRIGRLIGKRAQKLELGITLHQMRNTYIVDLIRAGFTDEEIAETVGWSLADVRYMKRVYADRDEINRAKVRKLRRVK